MPMPPVTRRPVSRRALLLAAVLLGCASDDTANRTHRASGSVCVHASADAVTFSVGFGELCLDPCVVTAQSCSATVDGDVIRLTTSLERTGTNGASECPASCLPRVATCDVALPTPGNYFLVLDGGRTATVALPPAEPIALFGDGDCTRR